MSEYVQAQFRYGNVPGGEDSGELSGCLLPFCFSMVIRETTKHGILMVSQPFAFEHSKKQTLRL